MLWSREKHFEFVHHNVSANDMSGNMEHTKFGKVGLNNHVSLSHGNVLQRAHQWTHFRIKKHFGVTLARTLHHMSKSSPTWVNPL